MLTTLRLTELIRNAEDADVAEFVNAMGDGAGPEVDNNIMQKLASREELMHFVFPDEILQNPIHCLTRAILAPTNEQIDRCNNNILERFTRNSRCDLATDSILECPDGDENDVIAPVSLLDYVAKHPTIGISPASLKVKVGGVYRIMINFSIDRGIVKCVRVFVTDIGTRLVSIRVLRPDQEVVDNIPVGEDILLLVPRITFTSNLRSRHTLVRRQFSLAPAYACTFNGCQGLTCDKIGADLTRPVFSHELYTELSRIRKREGGTVLQTHNTTTVRNVTYIELL